VASRDGSEVRKLTLYCSALVAAWPSFGDTRCILPVL
jgi:hypothetical protein